MGHNQMTDVSFDPLSHQWFIFCGLCCQHDEEYLGPQGNNHRRQILVLHEVEDGKFDPPPGGWWWVWVVGGVGWGGGGGGGGGGAGMFVSLRYLQKAYS